MLYGATFLILTDIVSRTILAPSELPIGAITALIGAPIFALILFQKRAERSE
jgi:iron complex transport system permease protein